MEFLKESLECLRNQTYTNWECIIVDDGSNEETLDLIKEYLRKDSRIRSFSRPRSSMKGAAICRNIGFEQAKGELIQYLDSDDLLSPDKLELQVKLLSNYSNSTLSFCNWKFFDDPKYVKSKIPIEFKNSYTSFGFLEFLGNMNTFLPVHSYLTHRKLVERAGRWNENLSNNDDAEFFTRILVEANSLVFEPKSQVYYRKNDTNSLSNYSNHEKVSSVIQSWELIEQHLKDAFAKDKFTYVENAKARLFRNINWENPDLIKDFPKFFNKQLKEKRIDGSWGQMSRFLKRLKRKFKTTFSNGV